MTFENGLLKIPTLDENIRELKALYEQKLGIVDVEASSALGADLAITSEMKKRADEALQFAVAQQSPYTAIDEGLESLCFLAGLKRKKNEHTVVYLSFIGVNGTIIPKATEVKNTATNEIFLTDEAGTIAGGVFEVYATAQNVGEISASSGNVNSVTLTGVSSVINNSDGVTGYLLESNSSLRSRLLNAESDQNSIRKIYTLLSNINNVKYVKVKANSELTPDANGIDPKSLSCVVLGGTSKDIARAIYESPANLRTFGTSSETTSDPISGNDFIIYFSRPIEQLVTLDITISRDATFNLDDVGVIRESILNYFSDTFQIGDAVVFDKLSIPILLDYNSELSSFKGIVSLDIALDADVLNVPIAYDKIAVLNDADLTIVTALV